MSIDCCSICEALIDTDEFPEVYREAYRQQCVCDTCWDEYDRENLEEDEE